MAKRKRTETISLRVDRSIKIRIEALSAIRQLTATSLLEQLIFHASQEQFLVPGKGVKPYQNDDGMISLEDALNSAEHEVPELFKIRLYYIAPNAVGDKDRFFIETILDNLEIFGGDTPVFDDQDIGPLIDSPLSAPSLDLVKIRDYWGILNEWHNFTIKNPTWNFPFGKFLELLDSKT